MRETLELALRFHPNRRRLIIFGDTSVTGVAIRNQVQAVEGAFTGRLTFEYEDNLSLSEILDRVRNLADDAMSAAPSPGQRPTGWVWSGWPTAERSFSTKSARCR